MSDRRTISPEQLAEMIGDGSIDTVLTVFPDLQGRLMGKRVTGHFYLDHVSGREGFEACNYLIATDVDMVPVPGYAFANYELGYGDMRAVIDPGTIRMTPWLEKTALVMCDLEDVDSAAPISVAPRNVLKRQVAYAAELGITPMFGSEIEFFLFRESFGEIHDNGYRTMTPYGPYNEDYCIRQTSFDEFLIRQIRNDMDAAGVPIEFSKGEAESGQHEINLRYTDALEMADRNTIYKNGAKEIAEQHHRAITFMAKYDFAKVGSSGHVHSSWYGAEGKSLFYDHDAPLHMSDTFRWYLGGLMATARQFSLLFAPNINSYKRYQPGSWAPTAIAWGTDNRTCGFRVVGHGQALRVESRIPGSDMNSYFAFAATIAGGLYGVANKIEPPARYQGNGYEATDVDRIPWNFVEAMEEWRRSDIAKAAFGDDVHAHILNLAEQEWLAFNRHVTDWEVRRNFTRI
ncbi:MAG: glutamine synthetase family protein [Acidimicrobiia bacterium]